MSFLPQELSQTHLSPVRSPCGLRGWWAELSPVLPGLVAGHSLATVIEVLSMELPWSGF